MMYAQYCRIESRAGGVSCTRREFIRAARTMLEPSGKLRANRAGRHAWLRDGLLMRLSAREDYGNVVMGRFDTTKPARTATDELALHARRTMYHT